ncbi:FAD-binding oxidoreductase [Candidatus Uhrbacteria bacterium]|nr:FAD-binding oxidoreductase [Candidatus Uhrbacteria bacterium]
MQPLPESTWQDDVRPLERFPKLGSDVQVDVAIVGAGLAGLCTAYELSKTGLSVAVLNKSNIGNSATGYTTAFATYDIDTNLADLAAMYGKARAKMVWESGRTAIDWLEETLKHEEIEAEFMRCPLTVFAHSVKDARALDKEAKTAMAFGFPVSIEQVPNLGFTQAGHFTLHHQAKCHATKALFGLTRACAKRGVKIYEDTEVTKIQGRSPLLETSTGHVVQAKWVLVASYYPVGRQGVTAFKKARYESYVLEAKIPSGRIKEGLYLDTSTPYHYFRVDRRPDHDRLILGGEDHRADIPVPAKNAFTALHQYLDRLVGPGKHEFVRQWQGHMIEPSDGLPLIGLTKPRRLVATGFSGNGFTYAPITALLCRAIIQGEKHPWQALYNPRRIPNLVQMIYKGRDYSKIMMGGALKNLFKR